MKIRALFLALLFILTACTQGEHVPTIIPLEERARETSAVIEIPVEKTATPVVIENQEMVLVDSPTAGTIIESDSLPSNWSDWHYEKDDEVDMEKIEESLIEQTTFEITDREGNEITTSSVEIMKTNYIVKMFQTEGENDESLEEYTKRLYEKYKFVFLEMPHGWTILIENKTTGDFTLAEAKDGSQLHLLAAFGFNEYKDFVLVTEKWDALISSKNGMHATLIRIDENGKPFLVVHQFK